MNMMTTTPIAPDRERPGPMADISTSELFGDASTITIAHEDMVYTLRITRHGKLLLTK